MSVRATIAGSIGPVSPGRARTRRGARPAGQGLVEYGLIIALIAVVCALSLLFFGDALSSLLSLIATQV